MAVDMDYLGTNPSDLQASSQDSTKPEIRGSFTTTALAFGNPVRNAAIFLA